MEAMEAAGVGKASKKAGLPLVVVLIAGVIGALGSVAALGRGSYDVTPFKVDLSVAPNTSGTTELSMKAPGAPSPGKAKSVTHQSPLAFGVTVTGIDTAGLAKAVVPSLTGGGTQTLDASRPDNVLRYIQEHDKSAVMAFALKVAGIAFAGGFALSLVLALGNWRRALLGAIAGLVVLGILGFVAKITYDTTGVEGLTFKPNTSASAAP